MMVLRSRWSSVIRVLLALAGLCAIAWAGLSFQMTYRDVWLSGFSQRVLGGEKYSQGQLSEFKEKLDSRAGSLVRPSNLTDAAIVRLSQLNSDIAANNSPAVSGDLPLLRRALLVALEHAPTESFLWLVLAWCNDLEFHDRAGSLRYLTMSYSVGPNEGWIAIIRNPIALKNLAYLPHDVAEAVLSEFVGLVTSGLYGEAAQIFAGAELPLRERLLIRMGPIAETDRSGFAKAVKAQGIDVFQALGIGERPGERFGR